MLRRGCDQGWRWAGKPLGGVWLYQRYIDCTLEEQESSGTPRAFRFLDVPAFCWTALATAPLGDVLSEPAGEPSVFGTVLTS